MRTKVVLSVATILMLVIGVAAIASNMGFKINIQLTAGYRNFVALPYFNQYTDAGSLFTDIPNCQSITRWDNPSGSWETWHGRGTNFALNKGEALLVQVNSSSTWMVAGSTTRRLLYRSQLATEISFPFPIIQPLQAPVNSSVKSQTANL